MQIPICEIKIKSRIRKDMGNISALAESLKRYGQISPIVISKKNILIAGGRRLEAAKSLGWSNINAIISQSSDVLKRLELEVEENIQRSDLNTQELADAVKKLNKLRNPGFFRRIWNAIVGFFKILFRIDD